MGRDDFHNRQCSCTAITAEQILRKEDEFRASVYAPDAAQFIKHFCIASLARAHELGRSAHKQCDYNEDSISQVADILKYCNAYLELAACYGKQIGIMDEYEPFRKMALHYVARVAIQLQLLECFEPGFLV